jgi:VanZ family protein
MLNLWRKFIDDFNVSDDFPDDPAGALANQIGHIATGMISAQVVFFATFWATDTVWGKLILLTLALLPGALIEAHQVRKAQDRGKTVSAADIAWDLWFRLVGVLAIYLPLTEIDIVGALEPTPEAYFTAFAAGAASLIVYLNPRIKRRYGSK